MPWSDGRLDHMTIEEQIRNRELIRVRGTIRIRRGTYHVSWETRTAVDVTM